MRKSFSTIAISLLPFSAYAGIHNETESGTVKPAGYALFQEFDNQYNLGLMLTSGNLTNGQDFINYNSQMVNLELERLFDIGLWLDVNANFVSYYQQTADPVMANSGNLTGSQPNFGGFNANLGYAFSWVPDHILLTPYATLGRNSNYASYTLLSSGNSNLTQDYFWSLGIGGRIEYQINSLVEAYVDQGFVYNISQAAIAESQNNNNNWVATTTLGTKFNLWRNLQLGLKGIYQTYYYKQDLSYPPSNAMVPNSSISGMVTIGLTY